MDSRFRGNDAIEVFDVTRVFDALEMSDPTAICAALKNDEVIPARRFSTAKLVKRESIFGLEKGASMPRFAVVKRFDFGEMVSNLVRRSRREQPIDTCMVINASLTLVVPQLRGRYIFECSSPSRP